MDGTQAAGNTPTLDEVFGLILSIDNVDTLRTSTVRSYLDALTEDQLASGLQPNPETTSSTNDNNDSQQQQQQQQQQQESQQTQEINDPIRILDPHIHSLGYLYFITARCTKANRQNALPLYHSLCEFINVADMEQVTLAGIQMNRIIVALDHLAQIQNNALIPLQPLYTLITRLSPVSDNDDKGGGAVLTIFHAALARQCILTKMYQYPLPILNRDIVQLDPKLYGTNIEHYLEYHYYGAILYIGNKEYEKAVEFFTLVISAPVQKAVSVIQLEAYKRYILVSLIAYGHLCALPKYVPATIEKTCRKHHGAYFALMEAFDGDDMEKLTTTIQKHRQTFEADSLLGLAQQLIQARYRRKIKMLTNIYFKVKLDDLGRQISGDASSSSLTKDQIEHLLVDMIGKNYINASLSIVMEQGTPVKMVQFHEETTPSVAFGSSQQLEQAITNIARANDQLTVMDKNEGLNADFQSKYMVLSTNSGQMAGASGSIMDEDMDVPIDD